jgi:hypothetical protein
VETPAFTKTIMYKSGANINKNPAFRPGSRCYCLAKLKD